MSSRDIIKFPNCNFGLPPCCQHLTGISLMLGHPASEAPSPRSTWWRPSRGAPGGDSRWREPLPACPGPDRPPALSLPVLLRVHSRVQPCRPGSPGLGVRSLPVTAKQTNTPTQQLEVRPLLRSQRVYRPLCSCGGSAMRGVSCEWGSAVSGVICEWGQL